MRNSLTNLMNETGIDCRHQNNRIFINPDEFDEIMERAKTMPKSVRENNIKLGRAIAFNYLNSAIEEFELLNSMVN